MRILINGGNGYVGSALSPLLKELNHDVVIRDIGWFGDKAGGPFQNFDASDFELIIHLAGHSSVLMSKNDPVGSWKNNVSDFFQVVTDLRSDQKLIYASSGSVYGTGGEKAWKESDLDVDSIHEYDMSKIATDLIAMHGIRNDKNIVGLRFGTINGLSPNTRIDLMLNAMVFHSVTQNVVKVKNPKISRPILFLPDLLKAMELIMHTFTPGIYNLASLNTTVEDAAKIVAQQTNAEIKMLDNDTKPYNFSLDVSLFESTYGEFKTKTIEYVIGELVNGIEHVNTGIRECPGTEKLPGV